MPVDFDCGLWLPRTEEEWRQLAKHVDEERSVLRGLSYAGERSVLRGLSYAGDVYEPADVVKSWNIDTTNRPYLKHIKKLSREWPQLKYLADWMEVTTTPIKWTSQTHSSREQRASRMHLAIIDLPLDKFNKPVRTDIDSISQFRDVFNDRKFDHKPDHLRLFVLEDLSRDAIEEFGSRFDIDPHFWRNHICDFRWYNSTDPWVELDELAHISRERNFWTIRYVHARQFKSQDSLRRAVIEAGAFNILRRLDEDRGHPTPYFSVSHGGPIDSVVCFCRRKISLWLQSSESGEKGPIGIIVVDPSVKEGFPLWSGYRSFSSTPSISQDIVDIPPRNSAFEEMIYRFTEFIAKNPGDLQAYPRTLAAPALTIAAAEWLTVLQYCTTRTHQVELDLQDPRLGKPPRGLESSLRRIYYWRLALPDYQKWVKDVLRSILSDKILLATNPELEPLLNLRDDFLIIQQDLDAMQALFQNQIMSMVSTVGAIASLQENQRTLEQNRDITRLTYLAVVFVPMSFVSSFLSMAPNVMELVDTFKLYFILALPLTFLALSIAQWGYLKRWGLNGLRRIQLALHGGSD